MEMVEKTRRSMAVLRRCQEADREELNYWKRRCSETSEPRKGGNDLILRQHSPGSSDSVSSGKLWHLSYFFCYTVLQKEANSRFFTSLKLYVQHIKELTAASKFARKIRLCEIRQDDFSPHYYVCGGRHGNSCWSGRISYTDNRYIKNCKGFFFFFGICGMELGPEHFQEENKVIAGYLYSFIQGHIYAGHFGLSAFH